MYFIATIHISISEVFRQRMKDIGLDLQSKESFVNLLYMPLTLQCPLEQSEAIAADEHTLPIFP